MVPLHERCGDCLGLESVKRKLRLDCAVAATAESLSELLRFLVGPWEPRTLLWVQPRISPGVLQHRGLAPQVICTIMLVVPCPPQTGCRGQAGRMPVGDRTSPDPTAGFSSAALVALLRWRKNPLSKILVLQCLGPGLLAPDTAPASCKESVCLASRIRHRGSCTTARLIRRTVKRPLWPRRTLKFMKEAGIANKWSEQQHLPWRPAGVLPLSLGALSGDPSPSQ